MELYRITHNYDKWDQSVGVLSDIDPTPMAVYCQFMAEEWIDDGVSLSNDVIAEALVKFYGCRLAAKAEGGKEIDMYFARESSCGSVYKNMMESGSYEREGLQEFILQNHERGLTEIEVIASDVPQFEYAEKTPFNQGCSGYFNKDENPYSTGTPEYADYAKGFEKGRIAEAENKPLQE